MDTKRLVLAFALSAAVLIGWYVLFPPPAPAPAKPDGDPGRRDGDGRRRPPPPRPPRAATAAPVAAPAPRAAAPVEPIAAAAAAERSRSSEPLYTARLSNEGGVLTSFVLLQHKDGAGKPLDLVRQGAPFPGATLALDPADPFLARAAKARCTVAKDENGARRPSASATARRTATASRGRTSSAIRTSSAVKVEREGRRARRRLVLGPSIGNPSGEELASRYSTPGATITVAPAARSTAGRKTRLKEPIAGLTGLVAAGLEDNYFLAAFLPGERARSRFGPSRSSAPVPRGDSARRRDARRGARGRGRERGRPVGHGHRSDGRLPRAEGDRHSREDAPGPRPRDRLRLVRGPRQAAPLGAARDSQVRRQLGRRDPPHHGRHQGPPLPAHAQAARLDEEDGRPAAEGRGDPHRSGPRASSRTRRRA